MPQPPVLVQAYRHYLAHEDTAEFVARVVRRYTEAALVRLLESSDRERRRGAVLALGWLGGPFSEKRVARTLRDRDRGVRLLAMNALPEFWLRSAGESTRRQLLITRYLFDGGRYEEAANRARQLLAQHPDCYEARRWLAAVWFQQGRLAAARQDYAEVVRRNRFHYEAIVGWGYCLAKLGHDYAALRAFRQALRVCPELDWVRWQARQLARRLS